VSRKVTRRRQYIRSDPEMAYVTGVCATGRKAFWTRAGAKALVRVLKAEGQKGVRAYFHEDCGFHHAGYMPLSVRQGLRTASECYPAEKPA
jgi:hypothetical protein